MDIPEVKGHPKKKLVSMLDLAAQSTAQETRTEPEELPTIMHIAEEFRNSHGGADAGAGTGTSYLCNSNCDMFNLTQ